MSNTKYKSIFFILKSTNKVYSTLYLNTRSLPCFNEFYSLFYLNGKKIVPKNIGKLLTARSLAYWSQDDGNKNGSGFVLNTQSFTKAEILLLIKVLKTKFDLNCSLHTRKATKRTLESYTFYIKAESIPKFKELIKPFFHESMRYKLD